MRIRTTCPIGISIHHKVGARGGSQQETKLKSPADVAKNELESRKVRLPGIMHVKTNLLDSICNIWPGEGEVLQSNNKTAKIRSISYWGTINGRHFGVSVYRSGARLALCHACSVKNL